MVSSLGQYPLSVHLEVLFEKGSVGGVWCKLHFKLELEVPTRTRLVCERWAESGEQKMETRIQIFFAKFSSLEYISEIFQEFFFGQFLRPLTVDPGGLKIEKFYFFSYYRALTFQ